ncbi:Heat-inducible transcription repressor HrcA [Geodia barretti]|uniref:Heat-inducible transcription repressor HrcA n=1 Tax=Geodia barretti TaxID=519541 RepID=A0AA35SEA3_GEOBA|nr:Heat-inducible transcription repressor HrcA [Geodia barretti]
MLTHRAGSVLNILVNEYISTANPVASEEIARLSPTKVSPATVRNAMSLLTEEGYISRPHVSAGAVPSDRGYRYYVEALEEVPPLPDSVQQQIHQHFDHADADLAELSRRCALILSRIATNMAIVTVPQSRSSRLKHIQLVYLDEATALLIIVLQEARLLRRLLPLEEPTDQDSLTQVANFLNDRFSGHNRAEIAASQGELGPLEERVRQSALSLLQEAETYSIPEHYVDGLRWLLNQPEMSQGSQARELVELLEEQVLLGSVLSEQPDTGDIAVFIGGENSDEHLRPFGVILCQYGIPQQASGTICVIGPTRMSYADTISGVGFLSSLMSRLVLELYGGRAGSG